MSFTVQLHRDPGFKAEGYSGVNMVIQLFLKM